MHNHAFFIALAYGVSAVLLVVEVISLYRRCRKANGLNEEKSLS